MSELTFNLDNGYLEGLVRGFKGGVLKQADYLNLVQCETLEGKKIIRLTCQQSSDSDWNISPLEIDCKNSLTMVLNSFCMLYTSFIHAV